MVWEYGDHMPRESSDPMTRESRDPAKEYSYTLTREYSAGIPGQETTVLTTQRKSQSHDKDSEL